MKGMTMRKILRPLTIGMALMAITAFAADNSLGTWRLNMEKSKFSPEAPVKSLTFVREASGDAVQVTATGERADGSAIHTTYAVKYDGSEASVEGAPFDTISYKQLNANTFTFKQWKKDGKYKVMGRSVVSKDGRTMTSTVRGTNTAGQPYRATMVWDKQ
jgi:hypothetical protein